MAVPELFQERMEPFVVYSDHTSHMGSELSRWQELCVENGCARVTVYERLRDGYMSVSMHMEGEDGMMCVHRVSMQPGRTVSQSRQGPRSLVSTDVRGMVRELMCMYGSDPLV